MTWVIIGHAYSNFVQGGIFVNNLMVIHHLKLENFFHRFKRIGAKMELLLL